MQVVCAYCGVGCKFSVDLEKNRLKPLKDYPTNKGASCLKGLSAIKTIHTNRLLDVFVDGKKSNYKDAIKIIANKIKKTDPNQVGFYLSGQLLNEDYYVANKLAKGFVKTANCDTNSRTCMASAVVGYKKAFGVDYVPVRMDDIDKANLLILVGANPASSHVVLFNRIKQAKKRGLKVVVIDPRYTKTAKIADLFLQINPGYDIDLFNALAKMLIKEDLVDKDFITNHTNGFSELKKHLEDFSFLDALKRAHIKKEEFDEFFSLIKKSKNIITAWTMGINQSIQGTEKNLAIINFHLLTGKINKPGNGPFSLTGQPNAMGGREVGGLSTTLGVHLDFDEDSIKKVEEFWQTTGIPKKRGLTAFEMIKEAFMGNLKVLIIAHTDPLYHLPNKNFVKEALKKIDLIVEINAYEGSQTSHFANIRLPALPFGQKEGTQTNLDRTLSRSEAFFDSDGILQDWQIFAMIGQELGYKEQFSFKNSKEVFLEYQEMTKLSQNGHLDIYKANWDELASKPFVWGEGLFKDNEFFTKNKKANLFVVEQKEDFEKPSKEYPFILLTGRIKDQWHSGTKTRFAKELLKEDLDFIEINEKDAKMMGIKDKDMVEVSSKRGSLVAKARLCDIKRGVVFIPISHPDVNLLTDDKLDPFSFEPDYNHSAVAIKKIEK